MHKLIAIFTMSLMMISGVLKAEVDINMVEKLLATEGLKGEIHGSSIDGKLFVITYRNPENFFENIQLPLTSEKPEILDALTKIKRHQFYLVKGSFVKNKSPIKHIAIDSMVLVKDYSSDLDHSHYEYKGDVTELNNQTEFTGRIHAIAENGKVLVMEYKDRIVPVFVTEDLTQKIVADLYRGDLIKIKFYVRAEPEAPTHISVQKLAKLGPNEKAIEVVESLVSHHGETVTKSGNLIKFPKSPQINFNIYALLVEDSFGTSIQFTLANLENPDLFLKIRAKIEKFWDEHAESAVNDRNKFVNRKIKVTAKGTYNMIDRGQANPQILIQSVDDVYFELL